MSSSSVSNSLASSSLQSSSLRGSSSMQGGGKRKVNKSLKAWVTFVKKVQKEEKLSYKDAIHRAKVRKDKGEKWMTGGFNTPSNQMGMDEEQMGMDEGQMGMDEEQMVMDEGQMGGRRRKTRRRSTRKRSTRRRRR
jgi:hypothetical protein